ncbi:MAG: hypothetical protein J5I90_09615 [Caldilineales bacterium]|nr:hypothetical protein [Caldilineales bacterium]
MSTSLSTKLSSDFRKAIEANPQSATAAIVRFDRLDEDCELTVTDLGLTVSRRLRLVRGLAVQGQGGALLKLAKSPRVVRIEPDQPVKTMHSEDA